MLIVITNISGGLTHRICNIEIKTHILILVQMGLMFKNTI